MRHRLILLAALALVAPLAACSDSGRDATPTPTDSPTTTATPAVASAPTAVTPFHAVPADSVGVTGELICDGSAGGTIVAGGPGWLFVCELHTSDRRVSGTQTDDSFRIYETGGAALVWVAEDSVIVNDEGRWRGIVQAGDSGTPCGEAHYVGEGAYDGLEFRYYFCDTGEAAELRGWITGGEPAPWREGPEEYAYVNGESLSLYVHMPADLTGAPIVVTGSPELAEGLVDEGVIVVEPAIKDPYDTGEPGELLNDHGAPIRAMAEQYACAIRFARERAADDGNHDPLVVLNAFSVDAGTAAHVALLGATFEDRWDEFAAAGGPPGQIQCENNSGSTHVDALVGMAGGYDMIMPAYDGEYGRAYQLERDPELQQFLASAIGVHPGLKVRLLHGTGDDVIPLERSIEFESALASAGYDAQLTTFEGGHVEPPGELVLSTILEVLGR
ncbi:MAG: hypothetical protein QNJ77_14535 [Acidimicrobiia bacterium]|nr:hypothetical protein [Acidimicrobiia bacterium]